VTFANGEIRHGRIVFVKPVENAEPDAVVDATTMIRHSEGIQKLQATLDALAKEL
jgi:hypothetical protein